jgi:thiol-disulfide isomerase/thioredoxin
MTPFKISGNIQIIAVLLLIVLIWLAVKWYKQPGVNAGILAPDILSVNTNGDSLKLSDLKGNWVLLDFWGSWCGPCRESNKKIVELYREYSKAEFKDAKGFTVFSVGIESNRENWLRAIQQDGLIWSYHVSSMDKFNDPAAKAYGIREIPATILISPQGNIMGVNLDYKLINAQLSKSLKK